MLVWEILGIFSLIIFVYKVSSLSRNREEGLPAAHFPAFSFAVAMISLLFFMSGQFIGGALPQSLGLQNIDPSPNFTTTMSIAKQSFAHNPVLGIGPNRFGDIWNMYKPASINQSDFWDVTFSHGSGLLPTFFATTGYLGIVAWILFLGLFILAGFKSIFSNLERGINKEMLAFFVLSLYLFIAAFFYSVGTVLFLLALAFTGVFIGLSASHRANGHINILFLDDHRKSFFSILLLVCILVAAAAGTFKYIERFASISYYSQTIQAFQTSTDNPTPRIENAQLSIAKTLALYVNDLYLRTYSQVYLAKMNSLAAKGSNLTDTEKTTFQTSLQEAISGAQIATTFDNGNQLNFQALGNVYSAALGFGVKDVYDKTIEAYAKAAELNPANPGIQLSLASAAFVGGKIDDAKMYANKALELKSDYLDAYITIAQIFKNEGDNKSALIYANQALSLYPDNQDLVKYVEALKANTTPTVIPETPKDNTKEVNTKKK
jgi:cytochrome c-type biogenesis protein CcmH/NrfG